MAAHFIESEVPKELRLQVWERAFEIIRGNADPSLKRRLKAKYKSNMYGHLNSLTQPCKLNFFVPFPTALGFKVKIELE